MKIYSKFSDSLQKTDTNKIKINTEELHIFCED